MSIFDRMARGNQIVRGSLKVLGANKRLIIFPILSGISLTLIALTLIGILFAGVSWGSIDTDKVDKVSLYISLFLCYIINYFVVVFFNMALMHCTKLYFDGEEASVMAGLRFSASRIRAIFSWAVFAATVGVILRVLQDNLGWLGKILTGVLGLVWSVETFFVVPVLAYEHLGPLDSVKRSAQIMKEKWGEGVGATFSFILIQFLTLMVIGIVGYGVGYKVNEQAGIILFVLGMLLLLIVVSTVKNIFISAVYADMNNKDTGHFSPELINGLFE